MAKRVVLAYSGGLDTSVAVRSMIEHLGVEVICLSADVGQEGTLEGNEEKALGAGAIAYHQLDLREECGAACIGGVVRVERSGGPQRLGKVVLREQRRCEQRVRLGVVRFPEVERLSRELRGAVIVGIAARLASALEIEGSQL